MKTYPTTTTLYFGPWYRRSPFFDGDAARRLQGLRHLQQDVPAGRVRRSRRSSTRRSRTASPCGTSGVERTVQISGPDADRLIDMLTCRDLTSCAVEAGQVHARHRARRRHRQRPGAAARRGERLVDAAGRLRRRPLRAGRPARSSTSTPRSRYPDVHPVQVQGPHSARDAGEARRRRASTTSSYYWCDRFEIGDIPVVISRTGWSAVPGFEVNLLDGIARRPSCGTRSWRAGEEFAIRPIAPNEARRVEAGIFNCGSDITLADTPFHVIGPRAPGRGAAAGLHRQGGARAHPPRGRRPQAGRDRVRLATSR